MIRGTRSRYLASIRFSQRSGGSLAWLSVETMKYFFGSPTRAVRTQPEWPGCFQTPEVRRVDRHFVHGSLLLCYSRVGVWHNFRKWPARGAFTAGLLRLQ